MCIRDRLVGEGIRDEMAFSIDELEAELIALLKPLAIEKCIAFDVRTEGVINRDVVGDCGRMLKILVNVISNSITVSYTHLDVYKRQSQGHRLCHLSR